MLWSATTGRLQQQLTGHAGTPIGVAVSEGGAWVVLSTAQGPVFVWDGVTGALRWSFSAGAGVTACALLDAGAVVVVSRYGMSTWDALTGERLCALDGGDADPQRVAIAGQGEVVAVCGGGPKWWGGQQTTIWDASTCKRLHTIMGSGSPWGLWSTGASPCRIAADAGASLSDWVVS